MFFSFHLPRKWLLKPKKEKRFHQDNERNFNSLPHMGNIMSKLQAGNRTQAVAQARMLGLLAEVA
jgi:hypothetical protein